MKQKNNVLISLIAVLCITHNQQANVSADLIQQNPDLSIVRGALFIVPNRASALKDYFFSSSALGHLVTPNPVKNDDKLVEVWATSEDDPQEETPGMWITAKEGVKTTSTITDEKQNWRSNSTLARLRLKSDNWAAHRHPLLPDITFPYSIPLSMIAGKKEGDIVQLMLENPTSGAKIIAVLRCHQDGYRYGSDRYGYQRGTRTFEKILASVTR